MLLDGYKFDLRIYVLVTSCDPLRIFLYDDGLVSFFVEVNSLLIRYFSIIHSITFSQVRLGTECYQNPNNDNLVCSVKLFMTC